MDDISTTQNLGLAKVNTQCTILYIEITVCEIVSACGIKGKDSHKGLAPFKKQHCMLYGSINYRIVGNFHRTKFSQMAPKMKIRR